MSCPDSLPDFWRQSFVAQIERIEQLYPQFFQGRAVKAIHDLRVTFRRMQSLWDGLTTLIPGVDEHPPLLWWRYLSPLGRVRDLDVQMERLTIWEQTELVKSLKRQRRRRLEKARHRLHPAWWQHGLETWRTWLEHTPWDPPLALEPPVVIPDLMAPCLSQWLLHPGWATTDPYHPLLHELRKLGKKLRYQAELFVPWYGPAWQHWIAELQAMQATLGNLHDLQVLHSLLQEAAADPDLQHRLVKDMELVWQEWLDWRDRCIRADYRQNLHRLVNFLQPDQVTLEA